MSRTGFLVYAPIARLLTMSIVWLLLLIWHLNAYRMGYATTLGFATVFGLFILVAGVEKSLLERRALFEECPEGLLRLAPFLDNRVVIIVREAGVALVLTTALLIGALLFQPRQWSVLFIDLLLLALMIPRMTEAADQQVPLRYRYAAARHWGMWISILLLWGEALTMSIFSPPQDYFGMRWQEVVTYASSQPEVMWPLLGSAAEFYAAGQALAVWAVQNGARVINDPTQVVMVWVGYCALFGFSLVVAWAYSRALVGVLSRPWEMWMTHVPGAGDAEPPPDAGGRQQAGPVQGAT